MSFFVCVEYQNKEKRIDKSMLLICHNNSLIIFCFLSLISQAGSSDMLPAYREGEDKRLGGIDNKVIRMYIIKGERQSHIESR